MRRKEWVWLLGLDGFMLSRMGFVEEGGAEANSVLRVMSAG